MKSLITDILPIAAALVTGIIGKIAIDKTTRRKNAISLYSQMEQAVHEAQNDIKALRTEQAIQIESMTKLLLEKQSLQLKMSALEVENQRLRETIERLRNTIEELQKKLNKYIRNHE